MYCNKVVAIRVNSPTFISLVTCLNEIVQSILSKSLVIKNLMPYNPPKHLGQNLNPYRDKIWLIRVLKNILKIHPN